jgi:hypothetical protein
MRKSASALGAAFCAFGILFCTLASAQQQQQPQLQEEVIVRWWLVPVYAIDKAGAPVLNLSTDDLEVFIKDIKVEQFTLHKKEFKVSETRKGATPSQQAPSPQPEAPPQEKMVFLVFDTASSAFALLQKAKSLCDVVMAESDQGAQYVLMSIDPRAGLHYVCGPTRDLKLLKANIGKLIYAKRLPGNDPNPLDNSEIHRISPPRGSAPWPMTYAGFGRSAFSKSIQVTSLETLGLILGYFRGYSKVVYLYTCSMPLPQSGEDFDALSTIVRSLNSSGTLLFLINPAGDRIPESDARSGEGALRIIANQTGGRYYEGTDKEVIQEVKNMEEGYYEVSFPDKPEYEGQELSFEIKAKKSEITIYTLRNVGREKRYADMSGLERELLVLNVLNNGPNALIKEKILLVTKEESRDGGTLICRFALPAEIAQSEFTVFKVARNFETGDIQVDTEPLVSGSANLEVQMKWRGHAYRHDVVLVHNKTSTIIVAK